MDKQKRDLFQPQTSANNSNYNQDKMARSSGDNDGDRIVDIDNNASEKTNEAYFSTLSKKPGANGLDQQDKSLKNSK